MNAARGFTLLEVMVAALILLLAVTAGVSLVAQGRRSYREAEARARLDDAAQAALDVLAYEVRMAGYLGRLDPGSAVAGRQPVGRPEPPELSVRGTCGPSLALDVGVPIAGADGRYAVSVTTSLGCAASPGGRPVAGSDTLVLRHAGANGGPPDAGRLQLETTRRSGRLFADGRPQLGPFAAIHDLEVGVFYVSRDSTAVSGRPSLRRKRLVGGTAPAFQDEEIQSGVADLQVEAQVAVAGADGNVQLEFVPIDDLPGNRRIRALRLWVLVQGQPGDVAGGWLPALDYANRHLPALFARYPRLLASRTVQPRNAGPTP